MPSLTIRWCLCASCCWRRTSRRDSMERPQVMASAPSSNSSAKYRLTDCVRGHPLWRGRFVGGSLPYHFSTGPDLTRGSGFDPWKEACQVQQRVAAYRKMNFHGCGVFAADMIQPMDVLAEFTGENITRTVAQQRVAAYRKMDFHGCVVQLAGDSYLDSVTVNPLAEGCSPRLFNHSCQANTYLHTVTVGQGQQSQEKRVFVCSLKSIEAGQELCISYPAPGTIGLGPAVNTNCACGSPACRGFRCNCEACRATFL
ncbi:unnamed protein product [Ectocarpus sp. 8 AP-2014]